MVRKPRTQGIILPYHGVKPRVAATAFIAETATLIGDVEIGDQASVWYGCILRGDVNSIRIGPRTNLQDGTIVHVTPAKYPTIIGSDVLIGHNAMIHGCQIEDWAVIGMRAAVLNGAVVDGGAVVAAGALITEGTHVRSGELWAGTPARRLRAVREDEITAMRAAVKHYIELAAEHRTSASRSRSR